MTFTFKKLTIAAGVFALTGLAAFLYLTRPLAAPSAAVEETPAPTATEIREGKTTFRIDSASSKVTFTLNEVLSGQPFTVVGETNQVTGDFVVDTENPWTSTVGTIKVNARGFNTDSPRRDGAIGRFILKSEDPANEFITFEPKSLEGMPGKIQIGMPYFTFKVRGDLTIAGITKEQVFEASGFIGSNVPFTGSASAVINRSDYNLVIPSVPFVANVDQQVKLKIEFIANPITE